MISPSPPTLMTCSSSPQPYTRRRSCASSRYQTTNPSSPSASRCGRRRTTFIIAPSWRILVVVVGLLASARFVAQAKELEMTNEWQLVGENDTLPAGVHVRMDLSTGQKWAKQHVPDDDEDEVDNHKTNPSSSSSSTFSQTAVAVLSEDESSGTVRSEGIANDADADDTAETTVTTTTSYDYDLMYRTLSQLPPEELERLGGLPEHVPLTGVGGGTRREAFEARLQQIWLERQDEIQRLMDEQVADIPTILKECIRTLQLYLRQPATRELFMQQQQQQLRDDTDEVEWIAHDTIVNVLSELEYLLSDLDMARDFHTLGGWPILASLLWWQGGDESLLTEAEGYTNFNNNNQTTPALLYQQRLQVQAHAAWALGTAVKNTGEFTPWVLETFTMAIQRVSSSDGEEDGSSGSTGNTETVSTHALDLVLQAMERCRTSGTSSNNDESSTRVVDESALAAKHQMMQKLVYALGSFLRGNPPAQAYFVLLTPQEKDHGQTSHSGSELLGHHLSRAVQQASNLASAGGGAQNSATIAHGSKLTQRILSLALDVLLEIDQLPQTVAAAQQKLPGWYGSLHQEATRQFASAVWCQGLLDALGGPTMKPMVQMTALEAIRVMAPLCLIQQEQTEISSSTANGYDINWGLALSKALTQLQQSWRQSDKHGGLDPNVYGDQLALLDQQLKKFGTGGATRSDEL